jgi:undecaprenyl pyrophosphate phosphatase UppP
MSTPTTPLPTPTPSTPATPAIQATPSRPDTSTVDDFMLKEYESIAAAHFDAQTGLRQQFRFYLLISAVPATILGLAFKDRSSADLAKMHLFELPHLLVYVFGVIGILGIFMLLSIIHTALDATLYARTVNGCRAYFADRALSIGMGPLGPYLKMPTDQNKPRYFHVRAFFWQVLFMAVINTAYIGLAIQVLFERTSTTLWISGLLIAGQFGMYIGFCELRRRKEVSG